MTTPLFKLPEIAEGVANQTTLHNQALRLMEAVSKRVLSKSTAAPPVGAEGNAYIIPAGATGAWAGKTNQIAAFVGGGWLYVAPFEGLPLWVMDLNADYVYQSAAWVAKGGGATQKAYIQLACSDEITAITAGTAKITFRMPHAMTLTAVRASLSTASTSGLVTVDVKEGGASIFSTALTIDATEKTSTTAAVPAVISDAALADDAEITVDIVGAGTGAKGLKLTLIGTRPA